MDAFDFAVPMAGMAGAHKTKALTIKIKLEGGARALILGLCKVGRGPSRWATAVLHISAISGCNHCFLIQGSHGVVTSAPVGADHFVVENALSYGTPSLFPVIEL